MRKVLENAKKSQKGAISTLVLFTLVMFVVILMGTYALVSSNARSQLKSDEKIQDIYAEDVEKMDDMYQAVMNGWDDTKMVNAPKLLEGMTPIKFITPTEELRGKAVETNKIDNEWYEYGTTPTTRKWANAETEDDSMWVWIPRFAYKIDKENEKIDVVFLIGTTDYYYDSKGVKRKAQRATSANQAIDATADYTVHPAFTDESSIEFYNGGWDEELTGIWVAKFEAGYASANNKAPVKASSVNYEDKYSNRVYVSKVENGTNADAWTTGRRNWLDGIYGTATTAIKYPTFQPLTYSMNYISTSDAFKISRALTESGNIYGLSSADADSHMMKNSEWGAVAYLTQSKYGRNGEEITVNNATLNSGGRERTIEAGKSRSR